MALKFHDISPLISEDLAVFPGDQKFSRKVSMSFELEDSLRLSSFEVSAHMGAHTDAPNHYHKLGKGMSDRELEFYLGACQVIEVNLSPSARIKISDLENKKITAKRILFKTGSYPDPNKWNNDFVSLSAELINYLSGKGVKLVGIDTPSIDLADDKILASHQAIFKNDMAILEGIVLDQVNEGNYILSALPLRIKAADASPVRAILIEGSLEELWTK